MGPDQEGGHRQACRIELTGPRTMMDSERRNEKRGFLFGPRKTCVSLSDYVMKKKIILLHESIALLR